MSSAIVLDQVTKVTTAYHLDVSLDVQTEAFVTLSVLQQQPASVPE